MDASKENCQKALENLRYLQAEAGYPECYDFVKEFLQVARKKLPSQESFDKERNKREVEKAAHKGYNSNVVENVDYDTD